VEMREMTREGEKRVFECKVEVGEEGEGRKPGDSFGIICQNSDEEVNNLLLRLKLDQTSHRRFSLHSTSPSLSLSPPLHDHIPQHCSIRDALQRSCDILFTSRPPSKVFLRALLEYCTAKSDRERLKECIVGYSSPSSPFSPERASFPSNPPPLSSLPYSPTLLQLLTAFPSCRIPLAHLLDLLPPLLPRYYSMSNDIKTHPKHVHFCFSEVSYLTSDNVLKKGLCTSYLASLFPSFSSSSSSSAQQQQHTLSMFFRPRSRFVVPEDVTFPLILIGPGTGIAPFIGFLQHRLRIKQTWEKKGEGKGKGEEKKLGKCLVFFGCRNREQDYLYKEELEQMEKEGVCEVVCAFSREQEEKVYVWHKMKEREAEVVKIVKGGGRIFVCGDGAKMAKDVERTFCDILQKNTENWEKEWEEMTSSGYYLAEVWS